MKKFLLVILTVMLVAVLAVPAMAADVSATVTPSMTVIDPTVTEEVVFTISVSGSVPYTSIGVGLVYDTAVFEYKSYELASITGYKAYDFDESTGKCMLLYKDATAYSGELVKITLKVKDNISISSTTVSATVSCKNENTVITAEGGSAQMSIKCDHTYGDWVKLDDTKHQRVCSKCSTPETETHDWNDGVVTGSPSCTDPGVEKFTCLYCTATKEEPIAALGHAWDNACDTVCNRENCGHTRTTTHTYATAWSSDGTNHWHACTSCGDKKDLAAHTPGPAATEKAAQTCTVCAYEIAPILAHVHEMSTTWVSDGESHWYRCNKSGCDHVESKARHNYDNDCDVDCNTCGAVRVPPHSYGELQGNAQGHWQICTLCGNKSDVLAHTPGPEATETEPQTCTECNFTIKMPLSHVHDYGGTWYSDDNSHWQTCTDSACFESTDAEPHTWDEPVELDDGSLQYTCTVCAYERITSEPIGTGPDTTPETTAPATQAGTQPPADEEGGSRFPWEWAGIAAIVLLIAGIVLLVIEFLRSRKTNMHGKFSK